MASQDIMRIKAFAAGEVTPEQAHKIGEEMAQRLWGEMPIRS